MLTENNTFFFILFYSWLNLIYPSQRSHILFTLWSLGNMPRHLVNTHCLCKFKYPNPQCMVHPKLVRLNYPLYRNHENPIEFKFHISNEVYGRLHTRIETILFLIKSETIFWFAYGNVINSDIYTLFIATLWQF